MTTKKYECFNVENLRRVAEGISFDKTGETLLATDSLDEASTFIYEEFSRTGKDIIIYQPAQDYIRDYYTADPIGMNAPLTDPDVARKAFEAVTRDLPEYMKKDKDKEGSTRITLSASLSNNGFGTWIKVTDRMPEERIRVLGWDGLIIEECFYGGQSSITGDATKAWRVMAMESLLEPETTYPITHWMPLPRPPKD